MGPRTFKHFQVLELLGKGGMGEVYLARDSTLERRVALKFLPRELLRDPSAQGRLLDEARSISRVQHPNIAVIHSIEEDGGIFALCMEYVEGRTLRELIAHGPVPLHRIARIGAEIAAAMHAAHEQGIVHRDLKPANVMVTHRGEVKVMDFGLALRPERVVDTAGPNTYGTVQYMSPEQARGQALDARSDIFSFGSTLYELTTGRPPFTGANDLAILNAIITRQPDPLRELRRDVPPALEQVVRGCMAKDAAHRWPSMEAIREELRYVEPVVEAGPKDLISELSTGLSDPKRKQPHRPVNHGAVGRRNSGKTTSEGRTQGPVTGQPAPGPAVSDPGVEIPEGFIVQEVRERGAPPSIGPGANEDDGLVIQTTGQQWKEMARAEESEPPPNWNRVPPLEPDSEAFRSFVPSTPADRSREIPALRTGEHEPLPELSPRKRPDPTVSKSRPVFLGFEGEFEAATVSRRIRAQDPTRPKSGGGKWKSVLPAVLALLIAAAAGWALLTRAGLGPKDSSTESETGTPSETNNQSSMATSPIRTQSRRPSAPPSSRRKSPTGFASRLVEIGEPPEVELPPPPKFTRGAKASAVPTGE